MENSGRGSRNSVNNDGRTSQRRSDSKSYSNRRLPICPYGLHKTKGYRHLLKDCSRRPQNEKNILFQNLSKKKAATGSAKSTRSQIDAAADSKTISIAGQLTSTKNRKDTRRSCSEIS